MVSSQESHCLNQSVTRPTGASVKAPEVVTPRSYLNRIPVTGLTNFLYSTNKWEKRVWAFVLVVGVAMTLYNLIPCIVRFLESKKVLELKDHEVTGRLGFPTMFVCVNNAINTTHINAKLKPTTDKLIRHPRVIEWARRTKVPVASLLHLLNLYMTLPPDYAVSFSPTMVTAFNELLYTGINTIGTDWPGYGTFYEDSMMLCDRVLSDCTFDNVAFSCCPKDRQTAFIVDATVCYKLDMNDLAHDKFGQQLIFHTRLDVGVVDWYEYPDFAVHFGNHPMTLYDAVYFVPTDTLAYVTIKATKRVLMTDCIDRFVFNDRIHGRSDPILQQYFKEMIAPGQYSMQKCMQAHLLEELYFGCGCVPHFDTMRPNDSVICTPAHLYICFHAAIEAQIKISESSAKKGGDMMSLLKNRIAECLPLCESWSYHPQITFAPLSKARQRNGSEIISNKVVITLDAEFREELDVLKTTRMEFFSIIGDQFSLFLGLSIITFAQSVVWATAAFILAWTGCRANGFSIVPWPVQESACSAASVKSKVW